jgi:8-oxo-dGTP pyrophosphatase MutT (NUDIX family)
METQHQGWTNQLKKILRQPKPAAKAHVLAAPDDRIEGLISRKWPTDAKQSAVTFLIFPHQGKLSTLLMERVVYNGVHSGQISLPGGQKDADDSNLLATAIREFVEETGIQLQASNYLGELSDLYIPPSHFLVQPYVAFLDELPPLQPDVREVQELHIVSLEELFHPDNFKQEEVLVRQRKDHQYTIKAPCYCIKELYIWGATAMMISELHWIFKENTFILPQ